MSPAVVLRRLICVAALVAAQAVAAADRVVPVTDFDRLQVVGAMAVVVTTSAASSVRVHGDAHDLETVSVQVSGQTLKIGVAHFGWGSNAVARAPITVYISTRHLRAASLNGSGRVEIDQLHVPRAEVALFGAGEFLATRIDAETLIVTTAGSGRMTVVGKAAQAQLSAQGSATLDASGLAVQDAKALAQGAATLTMAATRSADVTALGAASVAVSGHPACSLHGTSAGRVTCSQ